MIPKTHLPYKISSQPITNPLNLLSCSTNSEASHSVPLPKVTVKPNGRSASASMESAYILNILERVPPGAIGVDD